MNSPKLEVAPLPYGELAPDFSLTSLAGETITRHQFRGKQALVLVFFQPVPEIRPLFNSIAKDAAEYAELNARVLGIGHAPAEALRPFSDVPFTLLADPQGITWK